MLTSNSPLSVYTLNLITFLEKTITRALFDCNRDIMMTNINNTLIYQNIYQNLTLKLENEFHKEHIRNLAL